MDEFHAFHIELDDHHRKDYVAPKDYTYADFPAAQDAPEGMKTLDVDLSPASMLPTVHLDVVYAVKSNRELHLQIITPAGENKRWPLILWVQGSAFHKQDVGLHLADMVAVAKRGYVVAMVEYRWEPDDFFPSQIRDLHTATRFMLAHAATYHVDPKRYLVWGDSSGGHTVTMATVTADLAKFNDEDVTVSPLHYAACVDFYGPTDISRMNKVPSSQDHVTPHSVEGELFGSQNLYDVPELVQKGNPIQYIGTKPLPPFLIMHGNKDRVVPFEQSVMLYQALKKQHHEVSFYRLRNSDHASDDFFAPEVLDVTFAFIQHALAAL